MHWVEESKKKYLIVGCVYYWYVGILVLENDEIFILEAVHSNLCMTDGIRLGER